MLGAQRRRSTERAAVTSQSLSGQLRAKRSEMMAAELEAVALRLFADRGFHNVTVDDVAAAAQTSARTFYRYFPSKDDVLQLRIDRRCAALEAELAARPADEPPLRAVCEVLTAVMAAEDAALVRRWIAVVAAEPSLLRDVVGGIQLKMQPLLTRFIGSRLGLPSDDYTPIVLAAAVGAALQAAHTRWFQRGGDFAATVSAALDVLEHGIGATFRATPARSRAPRRAARPR
jgi:TetR/AcrR family transcriptional regulator, regulator of mycofactocin system